MSSAPPNLKHDLRTPLNHIIGFCEMLIEEAEDEGATQRKVLIPDLQRIHGAGRRLLGVINDLFDDSIPEAERLKESHIHHEVRTPLSHLIGYTELLQEEAGELGDQACLDDLAKIHSAAHRLLELVLSNIGSGCFRIHHPAHSDHHPPVDLLHKKPLDGSPEESRGEAGSLHLGNILVADDDSSNREMLARRLRRLGHTVDTAENGKQAVAMLRSGRYGVLLLDIEMPEMDGYEVLTHLSSNPPPANLPVIVLSASDDSDRIAHCIALGAEDYLPKPFDPALLQARIASSLEKKRLRDQEAAYLQTIQREKERSDDLLHVILPPNIAAELKTNGEVRPRRIDNVAVLFSDVVGFTSYCENRDPESGPLRGPLPRSEDDEREEHAGTLSG